MPRHSKNNTASAVFTKAEYGMLRDVWGTKSQRLGSESMRHFDQCSLCLATVRAPVACTRGHLFCRECILSSLLEQKRDLASLKASLDTLAAEHDEQRQRARQEAIARVERDFERVQSAGGSGGGENIRARAEWADGAQKRRGRSQSPSQARDRSRSPSRNDLSLKTLPARVALQTERAIADTMKQLEVEQALAKKQKIPAYWLPSLTPSADADPADVVRRLEETLLSKGLETRCYVADQHGHATTIKSLVDVKFVTDGHATVTNGDAKDKEDGKDVATKAVSSRKICPGCRKTLNDVMLTYTLRRCGHVHCAHCVDSLLLPVLKRVEKANMNGVDAEAKSAADKPDRARCIECGISVKSAEKDLIALQREGTGFASGGMSESKRKGIAFQG